MSPKASTRLLATQSDERLAALVCAGHDRAFEALVLRHRPALLRYCRRLSLSDSRAEDVVQQSLLQAWTALRRGAEVRELRAWLYRIVHNTAINAVRSSARHGQLLAEPEGMGSAQLMQAGGEESDLGHGLALQEALGGIAALPQMQREVIFRTAVAGHSHDEVASALGLSDGAVRGLLYRARASLRSTITALTPPPLLSWMVGTGQGAGAERIGELAAGGGGLSLGGLVVKGIAAVTAGTLLTGAVIEHAQPASHHRASNSHPGAGSVLASLGGTREEGLYPNSETLGRNLGEASAGSSLVGSARLRRHRSSTARHSRGKALLTFRSSSSRPLVGGSDGTGSSTQQATKKVYTVSLPSHGPAGAGPSEPSQGSTGSPAGGGSSEATQGASGGGTGSAGNGAGAGGGEAGSSGSGGGGSSSGGGSAGSGSPAPPAGGAGGTGEVGGGAGGEHPAGGGGAEGGSGSSGSSGSTGPVGTVVHEVTGLLENTVHGVLGAARPSP